jgi:hypothetical protein
MTMETMTERVVRGAALLDERMPGWEAKIDLDRLDLDSVWECVLGQLYGQDPNWNGYDRGKLVLGGMDIATAADHGFSQGETGTTYGEYRELTNAWCDLILSRRAAVHLFALVA